MAADPGKPGGSRGVRGGLHRPGMLSILVRGFCVMNAARTDGLPGSFFELIRVSDMPVLVDFWAEWCGPCRTVSPAIERIAHEYAGRILTVKVNVDRKPHVAQAYEVQGIPTIMLFWKGEPRMRLTGAYPYDAIRQTIDQNWPWEAAGPGP